jgi:hypothetical protein
MIREAKAVSLACLDLMTMVFVVLNSPVRARVLTPAIVLDKQ